jgi:hypothetical protein
MNAPLGSPVVLFQVVPLLVEYTATLTGSDHTITVPLGFTEITPLFPVVE